MDLTKFNTENLFNASKDLFSHLGVSLKTKTEQSITAKDI